MKKEQLKISAVQYQPLWHQAEKNRERLSEMLADLDSNDSDIIVLSEMFTTGFSMDASQAEAPDGPSVQWMIDLAAKKQAAVCGSLIIKDGSAFYNRLYWVKPDGAISTYNKRHLFNYAGEGEVYTAGSERLIVDFLGWRICPLVCYDLRFPVWSRNNGQYDLLIFVANWPTPRSLHWKHLLLGRAIENQSYTMGVNIVGTDGNEHEYKGETSIIAYDGTILQQHADTAGIVSATLDKATQDQYRQKLPFLKDGDSFSIEA